MSEHILVETHEAFEESLSYLGPCDDLCMDTETDGTVWLKNKVVSVQVGDRQKSFYYPFRHGSGHNLPVELLRRLMAFLSRGQTLGGYNLTFDLKIARKDGLQLPPKMWDPLLMAYLMNENEDSLKMEGIAARYLDPSYAVAEEKLIDQLCERFGCGRKSAKGHLWKLPARDVMAYGLQDIDTTWDLRDFYTPHLETWGLARLSEEKADFQLALTDMELRGIPVNREKLVALGREAGPKADALEKQIQEQAREDLGDPDFPGNPRSHPQMGRWLKPLLHVPNTKRPTLEPLDDPRANLLLDYRVWQKLEGSFVTPYLNTFLTEHDRIHPGLHITTPGTRSDNTIRGAASGRLSSSKPNMQQAPDPIKECIWADDEDHVLVEFDYSQAELRLGADYWVKLFGEPSLAQVLLAGQDVHGKVAKATGVPRKKAKIRNFSIEYGSGARGMAQRFGTREADERRYIRGYYATYPGSRMLMRRCERVAETQGYLRMWSGRVRHFNHIRAKPRNAKNNLIQGGVAEIVRRAITRIWREVPEAQMILTVHDSIVFLIPKACLHECIHKIRYIMQDCPEFLLPMVVDVKVGRTWKGAEEIPRNPEGIPAEVMANVTDPTLLAT